MASLIPDLIMRVGHFLDIASHQAASHINPVWRKALLRHQSWPPLLCETWLPFMRRQQLTPTSLQLLAKLQSKTVIILDIECSPLFIPHINWSHVRRIELKMKQLTDSALFWLTDKTPKLR